MKQLRIFILLILIAGLLPACSTPADPTAEPMIRRDEKIGEMMVTTDHGVPTPYLEQYCDDQQMDSGDCEIPASVGKIAVSRGLGERTPEELDTRWAKSTWQLFIDGRPVDLESFGHFDMGSEGMYVRTWNVVLENPPLGVHTARYIYDLAEEHYDQTFTFTIVK